jgi:hypothetical protein
MKTSAMHFREEVLASKSFPASRDLELTPLGSRGLLIVDFEAVHPRKATVRATQNLCDAVGQRGGAYTRGPRSYRLLFCRGRALNFRRTTSR